MHEWEEGTPAQPNVDPIVDLYLQGGAPATSSGFRVLATGEYQVAEVARGAPVSEWRTIWVYSEPELRAVRAAIDSADDPPLPAEVKARGMVRDAGTARWRLRTSKRIATVTIVGFPAARLPPLDQLYADLQRLHAWPAAGSVWRVEAGSATVLRTARCDALTLPALQNVIRVLYPENQDDTPGAVEADDVAPAMIDVTWYADDKIVDRLRVFSDGRRQGLRDGVLRALPPLGPDAVTALRAAIQSTPWASLPEPLCDTAR